MHKNLCKHPPLRATELQLAGGTAAVNLPQRIQSGCGARGRGQHHPYDVASANFTPFFVAVAAGGLLDLLRSRWLIDVRGSVHDSTAARRLREGGAPGRP